MCEAISASTLMYITMATAAAGAVYTYTEQNKAAAKTEDNANKAYALQLSELQDRYEQINQNSKDQMSERAREARIELARIRAVGAESGLSGVSQDRLERESEFLAGSDVALIETNRANSMKQAANEAKGIGLEHDARLSSIQRPSMFGTGLQIAQAGVQAYSGYRQATDTPRTSVGRT